MHGLRKTDGPHLPVGSAVRKARVSGWAKEVGSLKRSAKARCRHVGISVARAYLKFVEGVVFPALKNTRAGEGIVPRALLGVRGEPLSLEMANNFISHRIQDQAPALIGRFSSTELNAVLDFYRMENWSFARKMAWQALTLERLKWPMTSFQPLTGANGYFTGEDRSGFEALVSATIDCLGEVDLLGSWVGGENHLPGAEKEREYCSLSSLEPFFAVRPWTAALEGRKVLVVHPFEETIRRQYKKRALLFPGANLLPDFDLQTLSPPWNALNNSPGDHNLSWADRLSHLREMVTELDFDVAIIGAGAYGMPLGHWIKESGRVAVVMGAATQLLFGIWGNRWEEFPRHRELKNAHWVRPSFGETPLQAASIERAAYW